MRTVSLVRSAAVVLCFAIVAAVARPTPSVAETIAEPVVVEPQVQPPNPACLNLSIQALNAATSLALQLRRMFQVCAAQGWTSPQCLVQIGLVSSAAYWAWWTASMYFCNCPHPVQSVYCAAIGALPPPANPGGNAPLPPPGRKPPGPAAAAPAEGGAL